MYNSLQLPQTVKHEISISLSVESNLHRKTPKYANVLERVQMFSANLWGYKWFTRQYKCAVVLNT